MVIADVFSHEDLVYLHYSLIINKSVSIDGSGRFITISGDSNNDGSRNVRPVSIFSSSSSVTLTNLSIVSGTIIGSGGGIYNLGKLALNRVTIFDNTCDHPYCGGAGVYSKGSLTVRNSTLSGNKTSFSGGGIYIAPGTATVPG